MPTNSNLSASDIAQALKNALPGELAAESDALAAALMNVLSEPAARATIPQSQHIVQLIQLLSGRNLTTPQAVLAFGENNTLGDVTIGDVAGGNITTIHMNIQPEHTSLNQVHRASDSDTQHKLKLLDIHKRRVHILEQQAAYFGALCPPHISLEIEDTHAKMNAILRTI